MARRPLTPLQKWDRQERRRLRAQARAQGYLLIVDRNGCRLIDQSGAEVYRSLSASTIREFLDPQKGETSKWMTATC